jgi:hypothetical protein
MRMRMEATKGTYFRREKESNAATVLYEIDMLRFARERLLSPARWFEACDEWLYLEAFLLHYRNLIEFFGKKRHGPGDLSILRPDNIWPGTVPEQSDPVIETQLEEAGVRLAYLLDTALK